MVQTGGKNRLPVEVALACSLAQVQRSLSAPAAGQVPALRTPSPISLSQSVLQPCDWTQNLPHLTSQEESLWPSDQSCPQLAHSSAHEGKRKK